MCLLELKNLAALMFIVEMVPMSTVIHFDDEVAVATLLGKFCIPRFGSIKVLSLFDFMIKILV